MRKVHQRLGSSLRSNSRAGPRGAIIQRCPDPLHHLDKVGRLTGPHWHHAHRHLLSNRCSCKLADWKYGRGRFEIWRSMQICKGVVNVWTQLHQHRTLKTDHVLFSTQGPSWDLVPSSLGPHTSPPSSPSREEGESEVGATTAPLPLTLLAALFLVCTARLETAPKACCRCPGSRRASRNRRCFGKQDIRAALLLIPSSSKLRQIKGENKNMRRSMQNLWRLLHKLNLARLAALFAPLVTYICTLSHLKTNAQSKRS